MQIRQLTLFSKNISKVEKFYTQVLNLPIIDGSMEHISYKIGATQLTFKTTNKPINPYHFAINIPSNQIIEAKNWTEKKIELINDSEQNQIIHFENWNANSIYFYDLEQNILEFIARKDLNVMKEEPFNQLHCLSISEIGLATPQPQELATYLHSNYTIPYYKKGPNRTDFVTMGNESGLFVISSTERYWFPTIYKAIPSPLEIIFEYHGENHLFLFNL